jgi:hypothetical protein
MEPLLTVVEKVLSWLVDRRKERNQQQAADMRAYLKQIEDTCRDLIAIADPCGDEAFLLHEQIKAAYELASSRLPPELLASFEGDLYRGLSSARIYYWLRVLEAKGVGVEQLRALLFDRQQSPVSFELMVQLLAESTSGAASSIDLEKINRNRLRQICLQDIQQISNIPRAAA